MAGGSSEFWTGGARPSPATISITPAGGRRHLLWLRSLARSGTNAKPRKDEYICRAWTTEPDGVADGNDLGPGHAGARRRGAGMVQPATALGGYGMLCRASLT